MLLIVLHGFNARCEETLKQGKATDKTMFSLSWDIEELKKLSSEGHSIRVELSSAMDVAGSADIDLQQNNMP